MPFHQHTLGNGLTVLGETSRSARSVALGFFVRTGSRDETLGISGVSHFLEHMVFKGTERRNALQVNQDFDRIGAYYNASTSEETTIFYAVVLPEYLPQALDLLADILRPSLRADDFETEKGVIIEEIGMYEDQPGWVAYDHARQMYFANHPLGNSILGTPESIRALTRDQMQAYFDRRYVAPNTVAVAAGNFDWDHFAGLVEKHCDGWPRGNAPRDGVYPTRGTGLFSLLPRATVTQEHVVLMSPGPAVDSDLAHSASILAMVLGDESGSRLYWELEDPGLVDSADASFHDCDGTGLFLTSFSCVPDQAQQNLETVHRLLTELQSDSVTEEELQQAKTKVMSRLVRSAERPRGRMHAVGSLWTYLKKYRNLDEELSLYEAVTRDTIRQVLEQFPLTQMTTLALGPRADLHPPSSKT